MADEPLDTELHERAIDGPIEIRDFNKREIEMRIVPWDVISVGKAGPEVFRRGAFAGIDPGRVRLRLEHQDPPAGKGIDLEERSDGAYMTFRVSKTQRGDDLLTLAADKVADGGSVGYYDVPGGTAIEYAGGRRVRAVSKADLKEVSTTWRPTWEQSAVLSVRSQEQGDAPMGDMVVPEVGVIDTPPPQVDITPITTALDKQFKELSERFADRFDKIEERARKDINIPSAPEEPSERAKRGDWVSAVVRLLSGERVPDLQLRTLDDLITSDNVGVVPPAYLTEIIGVIDPSRPFLNSTRKLDLPAAGMSLIVPKILIRPTAAVQATQKGDVDSTATSITTSTFDAITIAGGGDIALQLLKRSSPAFLSLYLELLFEAYAQNGELKAIQTLLAAGPSSGGALNPEDLELGDAWTNGAAVRKPPNTIWLSSEGVASFIDAKASGTNAPLYSNIQAGFTAGSGPSGTISGLRPVYLPELDAASASIDVIVGPSSGFGWTEDGTYTLQVDVPAKAGRDVAVVGMLWFAPMYPTAFTTYTIAS